MHTSAQGLPLGAGVKMDRFKLIFLDVGLTQTILGMDLSEWFIEPNQAFINKGEIMEAFVGNEMLAYSSPYQKPLLYYWQREDRSSNAEVDYVKQVGNDIIPIEVKSGKFKLSKSMSLFLSEHKKSKTAIYFSNNPFKQHKDRINYPLYSVFRFLDEKITKKFLSESI